MEGGVERPFFDLKNVVGGLLDPSRDAEAVCWSPTNSFEDEQVEGAAEDFDGGAGHTLP